MLNIEEEGLSEQPIPENNQTVQNSLTEQDEENEEKQVCRKCGSTAIEADYLFPLCQTCRNSLIHRPVPLKIKAVFGFVLVIAIASLVTFPASLKAGIAYQRGIQAAKEKKYITANKDYDQVLNQFPDSTPVLARKFMAYYYNDQIDQAGQTFDKISGKKLSDWNGGDELTDQLNDLIDKMDKAYYPDQELGQSLQEASSQGNVQSEGILKSYLTKYPDDVFANYAMANYLFDDKKFDEAQKCILSALRQQPQFIGGNLLLASIYREKGDYDQALNYSRKVLSENVENIYAYVSMSKIELKRHNDEQGLDLAKKAYALDQQDSAVIAELALAYHYNNNIAERDKLIAQLKQRQDAEANYYLDFLNPIVSGKTPWRT